MVGGKQPGLVQLGFVWQWSGEAVQARPGPARAHLVVERGGSGLSGCYRWEPGREGKGISRSGSGGGNCKRHRRGWGWPWWTRPSTLMRAPTMALL
jgi:hypothetical protein